MKSLRLARVPLYHLYARRNVHLCRSFSASAIASSTRSIAVPTSQTTNDRSALSTIPTCPAPTCSCGEMPTDLDIDHTKPLRGLMPRYTRHIVIRTGQDDWESRIEDGAIGAKNAGGEAGSNLARELKELIGPKGKYYTNSNFLITNSSFDSWSRHRGRSISVYPEGYTVFDVGDTPESLEGFVKQFLMPSEIGEQDTKIRTPDFKVREPDNEPTFLICGHNSRDRRCGVMGPLLRDEVSAWIYRQRKKYHERMAQQSETSAVHAEVGSTQMEKRGKESNAFRFSKKYWEEMTCSIKVGLISHIGGHAWAGNIIIYLPLGHRLADGSLSPLAGRGVWYGRVEPKHVEGIIEETIQKGRIIEELLRGVHGEVDIM